MSEDTTTDVTNVDDIELIYEDPASPQPTKRWGENRRICEKVRQDTENHGRSVLVKVYDKPSGANSAAAYIRQGKSDGIEPGEFSATTRGGRLYVTYLGEQGIADYAAAQAAKAAKADEAPAEQPAPVEEVQGTIPGVNPAFG